MATIIIFIKTDPQFDVLGSFKRDVLKYNLRPVLVDGEDTIGHSAGCFIALRALRTPPLRRGGSGWNNLGVSQLSGWREEREAERCGGGTSAIAGVNMAETVRSLFDYRDPHSLDSDGEGVKPAPPLRG